MTKTKSNKIRNMKAFIQGYAKSEHGSRVVNRSEGSIPTGKHRNESFYALKGDKVVVTTKKVQETVWRNSSMAQAMLKAAQV